jgi:multiple sugar transport system substrate-binding protein
MRSIPERRQLYPHLLLILLTLWLGSFGCRRSVTDAGTSGEVTLHISDWGGASSDANQARYEREVAAEWQRTHPHIHIAQEHIPGSDEYVSKTLTAFVAQTEPDIVTLDASSAAVFIDNDTLQDLTPFAAADHLDLSVYYPNVLDLARRGARLFALPGDFTPMMLFYNKRLFDQARVPYPKDGWTWAEFLEDCRRLTYQPSGALHPSRYGFLAKNWMPGWIMWIWQNGGDVLTPDGKRAEGALDSPATVEALQFFADLVLKESVAPSLSQAQAQGADPFQLGLTAMQISGHWEIPGLKASRQIRLEDVGVVSLPQNRQRVTVIYEAGYSLTKRCRHPREAWEYIKFLSGPFVQSKKVEFGIAISARREIAEAQRNANPLESEFLDNVPFGRAPWGAKVENYAQVEDIGREMMDEILVGGTPVSRAARDAARRIDAELGTR